MVILKGLNSAVPSSLLRNAVCNSIFDKICYVICSLILVKPKGTYLDIHVTPLDFD